MRLALLGIACAALTATAFTGATARAQAHPAITRCTPMNGPPGTRVHIVGFGLRLASVYLGGEQPLRVVHRSARELTVVIPGGATSGILLVTIGDEEEACGQFEVRAAAGTGAGRTGGGPFTRARENRHLGHREISGFSRRM